MSASNLPRLLHLAANSTILIDAIYFNQYRGNLEKVRNGNRLDTYLDDIIISAPTFDGHLKVLNEVSQRLSSARLMSLED